MWSFLCCVMLMVVMARANPVPFDQPPANLDTPDDQDVGLANPQGGSSFFVPGSSTSSSSSSEEDYGSIGLPDGGGSVPPGTAQPGSGPVVGAGRAVGGSAKGKEQSAGGKGATQGVSDQNSGEKSGGGLLVAGDPAQMSKIHSEPKSNNFQSNSGKSAGIAIGVLLLVSVATVAIIFAIRKRRDGFMRFYSQANTEL
ncbi:uncharacterized protein LOC110987108 [Acanthaster planci]|uniref:Uncharacterized protein LOC110987108 n=1 Tax=Acanthaster planci TaxID=133434 RepID=A0A8B7ZPB9_ACAPL|nr:uncharacterized protein LOC110987108 [Acanthaster planci]